MKNTEEAAPAEEENGEYEAIDVTRMIATKNNKPKSIMPKFTIKAHMSMVTDMHYADSLGILATSSDDCSVHLWNLN